MLTREEQVRLVAALLPADTAIRARNLALVQVMLAAGLRSSEALALTVADIEWDRGRVTVRQGKGGKDRSLFLCAPALDSLRAWVFRENQGNQLASSNRQPSSNRPIFTGPDGRRPITGRRLRYLIAELAQAAGIEKRVHPHTLRHSFAANLLRQEGNVFTVMRALGHANLTTTQIYLSIEDSELERAMKALGGSS